MQPHDIFKSIHLILQPSAVKSLHFVYFSFFCYYANLKPISFIPLLEIGPLVVYKGFSLISFRDKPLLGDGYARVFFFFMYMLPAWHVKLVRCL